MATMKHTTRSLIVAGILLVVGSWTGSWAGIVHADPTVESSVWDGVYTDDQAASGKVLFERACVACHSDRPGEISGHGGSPTIIGEEFRFRWVDASIADLFDTIRQTMPEDAPSSLSAMEYAAVTAYVLQLNGYPAGSSALDPGQRDVLLDTFIDDVPPAAP